MQLYFPSREILRAALTSGAITRTVASAPVEATFGDGGEMWLRPSRPISKTRLSELQQLGARPTRDDRTFTLAASCWQQVLPAEPANRAAEYDANAMVLFELHGEDQLQEFVTEMLRLDNDRQSYRVLEEDGAMRTMLHVKGPPYYTLLRAIDTTSHNRDHASPPVAYREQAPGVWVQWGFEHPLAASMTAPAGQTLLIRPPHEWNYIEDGAFKDIYQAVKVELPQQPASLKPSSLTSRITVPLSLAPASSSQPARLWVLGEEGLGQLDEFVRTSDKRLVDRLSFAVGQATAGEEGQASSPVIVLRVRASNQPPPVLVLPGAIACRNYLKKPNLFIPCNLRLHPPVNPKVVNELLARDPEQIVWLQQDEDVAFRVHSLPDAAFQPLHKWVDYVLQREAEPLQAWVAAHQFEFEPFVCRNDQREHAKPPPRKIKGKQKSGQPATPVNTDETEEAENDSPTTKRAPVAFTPFARPEPGELEKELETLQQEFRASQEPLDSEMRSLQWCHLGSLYNALGVSRYDCTLCWVNGLWETPQPAPEEVACWLEAEKPGASLRPLSGEALDEMLTGAVNAPAETSAVCAYVVWSSIQNPHPEEVVSRLPQISEFLAAHERDMPVRMAWLAWTAVVAMSSGDELALARARDRLLGRLHQQGLQPNLDMASFLRTKGEGDANRIAAVQQQLPVIHRKAAAWVSASVGRSDAPPETSAQTTPLANLIFAFGLARLGDVKAAHDVRGKAEKELSRSSEMHQWCGDVFAYRIREAVDSRPPAPLDESLLKRLLALQNGPQAYAVDKYRERSRLLHDEQQIDEYAHSKGTDDELELEFIRLSKLTSSDEIRRSVMALIARFDQGGDKLKQRAKIVAKSLEYAPQIGDAIGRELLPRACDLLNDKSLPLQSRAPLLEKGVLVAAHFDHVEYVRVLVNALEETAGDLIAGFFAPLINTGPQSRDNNLAFLVDSLFKQCLRGMQKMGLRSETSALLGKLHEGLEQYGRKKRRKSAQRNVPAGQMDMQWCRLQMQVAAGYFYFGREEEAVGLVDEIRDELFDDKFVTNPIFKTRVVCGYIEALAQAPPQIALPRIEQLFNPPATSKPALTGVFDNRANAMMYMLAIAPLEVVEAAVFALCGEDAGIDRESRRWLDEDEFLVRRRIHRDVRKANGS